MHSGAMHFDIFIDPKKSGNDIHLCIFSYITDYFSYFAFWSELHIFLIIFHLYYKVGINFVY